MTNIVKLFLALILLQSAQAEAADIVGLWKAYNDEGKPTGYIRINQSNNIYTGTIEKGLPSDKEDKFCTDCKDERKNQKLIGMTVLKEVKDKGEAYEGSEILDPFTGNTYKVKLKLKDSGQKLEVRAYVGVSLFGRTQVWQRADKEN